MKSHDNLFPIYTDGSKSDVGVGFAAVSGRFQILSSLPSHASIFTAELFAIKNALLYIFDHDVNNTVIYTDSLSALQAINSYSLKHPIVTEIKVLLSKLIESNSSIVLCWIPSHIGLKGNEEADKSAKNSVNAVCSENRIPLNDIQSCIKSKIWLKWQKEWEDVPATNKLRSIKKCVNSWQSSIQKKRYLEVLLSRLRIGHTKLTHGYLMSSPHGSPPMCEVCQCQISIKHIFIDCPKYHQHRQLFKENNLESILAENRNFSFSNILYFLKQINLLNKIL